MHKRKGQYGVGTAATYLSEGVVGQGRVELAKDGQVAADDVVQVGLDGRECLREALVQRLRGKVQ